MDRNVIWTPNEDFEKSTNVHRFMSKHGIESYEELIETSTRDIEWFWGNVAKDLGIEWYEPYSQVLDESEGKAWAKWFVDGETNLAHNCLDKWAGERGDKTALIWEAEDGEVRSFSYAELTREVNKLANALEGIGLERGDRVGLYMPMVPEAVIASFAVPKAGCIYTPIFSGYGEEAVASRLDDCQAKVLLTSDGYYRRGEVVDMVGRASAAAEQVPSVSEVVVHERVGEEGSSVPDGFHRWGDLTSGQSDEYETKRMDSEDPFMIIYTSGTTGKPKGAVHVHGGFTVKIAAEVAYQVDLRPDDVLFWVTEMGWIMGPWEAVGATALGGTFLAYEGAPDYPDPDRLWRLVERHGVTTLGTSPTSVRALMRKGEQWVEGVDLSSLRILASTGEPWNPDPYRWFFEKVGGGRCPIINLSGGTEVGACFLSPLPITPIKVGSLGGPSPGMAVDVFDEDGEPIRGEVGELVCKEPWPGMTRGLWQDPERYEETYWSRWPGVWFHGDLASVDEDGYWYLHGRSDDVLKVAGKRLGPEEVESVLVGHDSVSEAGVVGVPHPVKGEVPTCFVVLSPGYQGSEDLEEELKRHVAKRLGKPFKPADVVFVGELPKTRNAKILRRAIRTKYLGEDVGEIPSLANPDALAKIPVGPHG